MTDCSGFPALVWDEVKLSLNNSFTGWPITFNPYVTFYYEFNSIGTIRRWPGMFRRRASRAKPTTTTSSSA